MFAFRAGLRVAARVARPCPYTSATIPLKCPSLLQSRLFTSSRPRYYPRLGWQAPRGKGQQGQQWSNFGPVYRLQYVWRNYRTFVVVAGTGGGIFYVANLEEVPITHRRRFNIISPATEKSLGAEGYSQILQQYQGKILPADHPVTRMVAKVVERLLPATGGLANDEWRVHVIDSPEEQNAFVMPGGKVFVFTGILPICMDDNGLAAVLAHEIAHDIAHHTAEKMSRGAFVVLVATLLSFVFDVGGDLGNVVSNLFLALPNNRTQELEADYIGLLMMADSCFDPESAAAFWSRMKEGNPSEPPQFLSTHPSHYNRKDAILRYLPEARARFDNNGCSNVRDYAHTFKDAFKESRRPANGSRQISAQPSRPGRKKDGDDDYFF
ncbi:uncharacterized protein A1O9_04740 [Exophiala aquamarina CBS 119918]|uniref:Peptidase M48 domain-containing protein n=1 Tax=Exophiala aquamarina CBS 119918 TaxID=1182545 RepID=A0A072PJH7_9EURO|nr:uncharacterized protein A1O9_04740 [Exophiala aquamarina CBS 119918]KEF59892.1 hypothetical protein A1O9_04740 [Exophiala aquamarina CBS 119918]